MISASVKLGLYEGSYIYIFFYIFKLSDIGVLCDSEFLEDIT